MAVLLNGITTIIGFGNLMVATHQGIFGLGLLLTIGTACGLATSLIVLPVILRLIAAEGRGAGGGDDQADLGRLSRTSPSVDAAVLFDFGGTLDADGVAWKERFFRLCLDEGVANRARALRSRLLPRRRRARRRHPGHAVARGHGRAVSPRGSPRAPARRAGARRRASPTAFLERRASQIETEPAAARAPRRALSARHRVQLLWQSPTVCDNLRHPVVLPRHRRLDPGRAVQARSAHLPAGARGAGCPAGRVRVRG